MSLPSMQSAEGPSSAHQHLCNQQARGHLPNSQKSQIPPGRCYRPPYPRITSVVSRLGARGGEILPGVADARSLCILWGSKRSDNHYERNQPARKPPSWSGHQHLVAHTVTHDGIQTERMQMHVVSCQSSMISGCGCCETGYHGTFSATYNMLCAAGEGGMQDLVFDAVGA